MRVIQMKCPSCKAALSIDPNIQNVSGIYYCQYCGKSFSIDDEVNRSEHVYRKIDEARILEAQNEKQRIDIIQEQRDRAYYEKERAFYEKKKKAKRRGLISISIIGIIVVLAMVGIHRINTEKRAEEEAEKQFKEKVIEVVNKHEMKVDSVSLDSKRARIDVEASSYYKNDIDALENDLIEICKETEAKEYSIDFQKGIHIVRTAQIDEYGNVEYLFDYTNSVSSEDAEGIMTRYEEKVRELCDEYNFELKELKYQNDSVFINLLTSTSFIDNMVMFENDLIAINNDLTNENLQVEYDLENNNMIRRITLKSNGQAEVEKDLSNSFTDEEQQTIIDSHIEIIGDVCEKQNVNLQSITMEKDSLIVIITDASKDKKKLDVLEKKIVSGVNKLDPIPIELYIKAEGELLSVRHTRIDINRLIEHIIDYSE